MPIFVHINNNILFSENNQSFKDYTEIEIMKYYKGLYSNEERFVSRFLNTLSDFLVHPQTKQNWIKIFNEVKPFTYTEAFKIADNNFKSLVFGSINIIEMIKELGHTLIKVDGMPVKRKQYNDDGDFTGYKTYDNIYELHQINGEKLEITEPLYAVKCWCTSTNKEHWLWVDQNYDNDPLAAIASTFRIHKNLIPFIKELKRQGDILLVELTEKIEPTGEVVSLTKEQYFNLLTAES